jgi:ABC-2 type transport system ATP-binding protein
MKRKLTIAAGIVHAPPILFLDEPTTGIDVASARRIRQFIADLHAAGTTIFLTTHYIEEAERLCGRIAFIVKGRLVRCDTVDNLLRPVERLHVVQCAVARHDRSLRDALRQAFPDLTFPAGTEESIRVESQAPVRIAPLVRFLEDHGVEVFEVRQLHPSLEDVFVQVTGLEAAAMQHDKERAGAGS